MEILISALVFLVVSFVRWTSKKFGLEIGRYITILLVFSLSLVYAILTKNGIITQEIITSGSKIFLQSVGIFEVVYKRILVPAFKE